MPVVAATRHHHQHGVPTTSRARTTLDLAPRLTKKQLTRLVNDQRRENHLSLDALADINARNPTDSPFEDDFIAFIEKYDLPVSQTNIWLHGRKVDAFYPEANLIIELDGPDFHGDEDAFKDDRNRDTENLKHGLTTMRMTTDRLKLTPDYEAERLLEIYRREARRAARFA